MLNITKKDVSPNVVMAVFAGDIGPDANFQVALGNPTGELQIHCKGVTRINSVGVKAWIQYFSGLRQKGVKLKFMEVNSCLVEQVNMISNFIPTAEIASFYAPYICGKCNKELAALLTPESVKKANMQAPKIKCAQPPADGCGAEFDDMPEEYFAFLERT